MKSVNGSILSRRSASRRTRGGFTLIEILLVVVLTSMLMFAMAKIFEHAARIVGVTEAEIDCRQKARALFSRLKLDLENAFVDSQGRYFEVSGDGDSLKFVTTTKYNPENSMGKVDLTQVAYVHKEGSQSVNVMERKRYPVKYEPVDAPPLLVRYSLTYVSTDMANDFNRMLPSDQPRVKPYTRVSLDDDPENIGQYIDIVASGVTGFKAECLSSSRAAALNAFSMSTIDTYWQSRPDNRSPLPRAMRIRTTITDRNKVLERCFESIMYPRFTHGS